MFLVIHLFVWITERMDCTHTKRDLSESNLQRNNDDVQRNPQICSRAVRSGSYIRYVDLLVS